jgi:hypothetical protein
MEYFDYLSETKNNKGKLEKSLHQTGLVEVGCLNCVAIYPRIKSMENLQSINNSLLCHVCGKETIIPIIEESTLKKCKSFDEQMQKLQQWNKEMFGEYIEDNKEIKINVKSHFLYSGHYSFEGFDDEDNYLLEKEFAHDNFDLHVNRCVICGIDMGPENPRQLCRKTYCENDFDD